MDPSVEGDGSQMRKESEAADDAAMSAEERWHSLKEGDLVEVMMEKSIRAYPSTVTKKENPFVSPKSGLMRYPIAFKERPGEMRYRGTIDAACVRRNDGFSNDIQNRGRRRGALQTLRSQASSSSALHDNPEKPHSSAPPSQAGDLDVPPGADGASGGPRLVLRTALGEGDAVDGSEDGRLSTSRFIDQVARRLSKGETAEEPTSNQQPSVELDAAAAAAAEPETGTAKEAEGQTASRGTRAKPRQPLVKKRSVPEGEAAPALVKKRSIAEGADREGEGERDGDGEGEREPPSRRGRAKRRLEVPERGGEKQKEKGKRGEEEAMTDTGRTRRRGGARAAAAPGGRARQQRQQEDLGVVYGGVPDYAGPSESVPDLGLVHDETTELRIPSVEELLPGTEIEVKAPKGDVMRHCFVTAVKEDRWGGLWVQFKAQGLGYTGKAHLHEVQTDNGWSKHLGLFYEGAEEGQGGRYGTRLRGGEGSKISRATTPAPSPPPEPCTWQETGGLVGGPQRGGGRAVPPPVGGLRVRRGASGEASMAPAAAAAAGGGGPRRVAMRAAGLYPQAAGGREGNADAQDNPVFAERRIQNLKRILDASRKPPIWANPDCVWVYNDRLKRMAAYNRGTISRERMERMAAMMSHYRVRWRTLPRLDEQAESEWRQAGFDGKTTLALPRQDQENCGTAAYLSLDVYSGTLRSAGLLPNGKPLGRRPVSSIGEWVRSNVEPEILEAWPAECALRNKERAERRIAVRAAHAERQQNQRREAEFVGEPAQSQKEKSEKETEKRGGENSLKEAASSLPPTSASVPFDAAGGGSGMANAEGEVEVEVDAQGDVKMMGDEGKGDPTAASLPPPPQTHAGPGPSSRLLASLAVIVPVSVSIPPEDGGPSSSSTLFAPVPSEGVGRAAEKNREEKGAENEEKVSGGMEERKNGSEEDGGDTQKERQERVKRGRRQSESDRDEENGEEKEEEDEEWLDGVSSDEEPNEEGLFWALYPPESLALLYADSHVFLQAEKTRQATRKIASERVENERRASAKKAAATATAQQNRLGHLPQYRFSQGSSSSLSGTQQHQQREGESSFSALQGESRSRKRERDPAGAIATLRQHLEETGVGGGRLQGKLGRGGGGEEQGGESDDSDCEYVWAHFPHGTHPAAWRRGIPESVQRLANSSWYRGSPPGPGPGHPDSSGPAPSSSMPPTMTATRT
uniref:Uncharacterized protein n=1 Tax=Chromera velia CCMP2878 TaxID=1169474 RepID=A0A0G4FBZ1_9ALVE|eukprot:Cvel_16243.t1-p1 / transcript=Cvel_16243.t1 / gene=Cvel_16243 / organism=Chromera_velia_CCMP2878 / gene_product=hypothetical protein / transcript_product=hypothetical protein / location=Cvel_scaffold1242:29930-34769(+) / protein_length=1199 / sequence_SO=supercontig / SO=protein_coding / is_pseudo=false